MPVECMRGTRVAGTLALMAWPAPAWAVVSAVKGGAVASGVVALVAVAGAIAIRVAARRRDDARAAEIAALASARKEAEAVLAAAPGAYCAWTAAGDERYSGNWAEFFALGDGQVAGFDGLARVLDDTSFERLGAATAELRDGHAAFSLDLAGRHEDRVFEACGVVARLPEGDEAGHVIWFRDVSRERAEAELQRREAELADAERERWMRLADGAPIPMWRRDSDLRIAWCNRAYARMFDGDPDEVVTGGEGELVSRLDPDQARRLAAKARDSGEPACEQRYFVVGGERRAFEIVECPHGTDGELIGIARDVTDREEARAELVRHTDAHAEVLQNVNTAIAIFGPDKRLNLYNRAYAELWHLEEEWLDGEPHYGEILERQREKRRLPEQADFQSFKKQRLRLFGTIIEAHEELLYLPDGTALRLSITPHPFGGLVFMYEDVTNQLDLERARNTLIAVQRASLDNLYEGVAVYGSDGRLKLYNSALARIWQLDEAALASEPHISDVVESCRKLFRPDDDWSRLKDAVIAVWVERQAKSGRFERADGSIIDYASVPLPDGAVLFTYLDITDSIRIERALRERNEALQTADRLKSEFIANVSYELRTPLNTIIGFTEILTREYFGELNERQQEYGQGILESSHQLLLLINDILDLATIEAGHMVLECEPFDLYAVLESVVGLGREPARRQDLELALDCDPEVGCIDADERRIKQVLFNLVSNAIKFTPAGGRVTVGAARQADEVIVWVADTGVGIHPDMRDQVFEKFHKGSSAERRTGAGLGLSLVKSFVELHGGRVELESAADQGTRVTCRLPAAVAVAADARAEHPAASAGIAGND